MVYWIPISLLAAGWTAFNVRKSVEANPDRAWYEDPDLTDVLFGVVIILAIYVLIRLKRNQAIF